MMCICLQLVSPFMQKAAVLDAGDQRKVFSGVDMVELFPNCWVIDDDMLGKLGVGAYGAAL